MQKELHGATQDIDANTRIQERLRRNEKDLMEQHEKVRALAKQQHEEAMRVLGLIVSACTTLYNRLDALHPAKDALPSVIKQELHVAIEARQKANVWLTSSVGHHKI